MTMNKLKWQIHAETSISQIMMWVIIGKLFGGWAWALAALFIIGNFATMVKSSVKLGGDYFKSDRD